jgi:ferredoxin
MAYVVTDACVRCKFTDCVATCPADCFHEGANMLVIDPVECIDCGACMPACPVNAIYPEDDVPDDMRDYIALNKRLAGSWPLIVRQQDPLDEAEEFRAVTNKRGMLSEDPGR